MPDTNDDFFPPAAAGLPAGTLEAAEIGANRLDAWARTSHGRNFLAHALVELARTGWLRTEPDEGFEPLREPEPVQPEAEEPAASAPAVVEPPADRTAVLREAADRIDREDLPQDDVDMFDNGARWATKLLRRMADETPAASTTPLASGLPLVKGKCPACGDSSLFLGNGGYVTCSRIDCPEPDAASTTLERPAAGTRQDGAPADDPLCICTHRRSRHPKISGRLLCDECDPDSTDNLVCKEFDAL